MGNMVPNPGYFFYEFAGLCNNRIVKYHTPDVFGIAAPGFRKSFKLRDKEPQNQPSANLRAIFKPVKCILACFYLVLDKTVYH